MIRFNEKSKNNRKYGKMNKFDTNNKYKGEEILNLNKILKFFINNLRYFSFYLALESDLTLENQKQ